MYKVSDAFAAAMANRPYSAKITLDNGVVIQSDPADREGSINKITFRGGANSNNEEFTLGGAVSASVEIVLNKEKINCEFAGRKIAAELVLENEALPMGVYYVTEPRADDDLLTVTACDALGTKFEREYEPLDGFSFDMGVSSIGFLRALCERRGIEVDTNNLVDIPLKVSPDGFTERQIIGFIAALNGGYAVIDRKGVLRIRSYVQCDTKVTPDDYYEGGLEKADYTFVVQWIKCYNEAADLTMVMGDMAASQGIYLESIWMTNEILTELWDKLQGFCYTPVTELSFFGNPLIDVGDIIMLEDLSGTSLKIPVMKISHEYDGGIITTITAAGEAETTGHAGNAGSQLKRAAVNAKRYADQVAGTAEKNAKDYAAEIDEALDMLELLKRLDPNANGLYEKDGKLAVNATAILTGVLDAALVTVKNLVAERLTSINGDYKLRIDGSQLRLLAFGRETFSLSNFGDLAYMYFTAYDGATDAETGRGQYGANRMQIGGTWADPILSFNVEDNEPHLYMAGDARPRKLAWKSNGDGTFTLIGT